MSNCQTVKTFSSTITNSTDFNVVSDAVEDVAKDYNMYLGEKRWIKTKHGYELRVGFAPSSKAWFDAYDKKPSNQWRF